MAKMFDWTITSGPAGLTIAGILVAGPSHRPGHRLTGVSAVHCSDGRMVALQGDVELCELSPGAWAVREADYQGAR